MHRYAIRVPSSFIPSPSVPLGDEAPLPKGKGGVKPTFTERPVIRQPEEDGEGRVVFECRLVGEPKPEVAWYHNEARLKAGRRHRITMEEAEEGKAGQYVRVVHNGGKWKAETVKRSDVKTVGERPRAKRSKPVDL